MSVFANFITARLDHIRAKPLGRMIMRERPPTFSEYARKVLEQREADGLRSIRSERYRFELHIASSPLGQKAITSISSVDVMDLFRALSKTKARDKRGERFLDHQSVKRAMSFVSVVMGEAHSSGVRLDNPCTGLKMRRPANEKSTKDPWGYLTFEEQRAIATCEAIPTWARLMMRIAWGTGLRQGELYSLQLADLHVDGDAPHVFVRFGAKGKPPKSGKTRRVPLLQDALEAAREWLAMLPFYASTNPERLVFPTAKGKRRPQGAPSTSVRVNGKTVKRELFREWIAAAGITRHLRWHDLRHTCASSLIAGWWGRTWSLDEVREFLGHSSVLITQRYAHLGETSLHKAARETIAAPQIAAVA